MPSTATAGNQPRSTVEEPNGHNSGGCAFCGAKPDGYDAVVDAPLCEPCALAFSNFRMEVLGAR
jgi:hypothetical protein